jgi:hypothetical protein
MGAFCFDFWSVGRIRSRSDDDREAGPKNFSPEKYFRANPTAHILWSRFEQVRPSNKFLLKFFSGPAQRRRASARSFSSKNRAYHSAINKFKLF